MSLIHLIACPGCGLKLPEKQLERNDRYNASGECFELFGQLSGYTLSQNDSAFIHQLVVDSYAAQHPGGVTKNITTVFALIGLCLALEHNFTGRQVQGVHMKIPKQNWPGLNRPKHHSGLTVFDVLEAQDDSQRANFILRWARAAWGSWLTHQDWVRQKAKEFI